MQREGGAGPACYPSRDGARVVIPLAVLPARGGMTRSEERSDSPAPLPPLVEEISRLAPEEAAARLATVPDAQVADLLRSLGPALADDLLRAFGEERRRAVLAAAPPEEGLQWPRNLTYPEDSVGRLMDPPLPVFGPELTVAETTPGSASS